MSLSSLGGPPKTSRREIKIQFGHHKCFTILTHDAHSMPNEVFNFIKQANSLVNDSKLNIGYPSLFIGKLIWRSRFALQWSQSGGGGDGEEEENSFCFIINFRFMDGKSVENVNSDPKKKNEAIRHIVR
jgi:hypothetical protein